MAYKKYHIEAMEKTCCLRRILLRFIRYIILVICTLVNVAFVTLLERKILGYSQLRKGPNKVRIIGVAQPFNDAIKLFSKELVIPNDANLSQYFLAPIRGLSIVVVTFSVFPFKESTISIRLSIIFIYIIMSMNVYPVLISGWSSNRKYALLGSLRSVAQTVSYEVRLALILIFYLTILTGWHPRSMAGTCTTLTTCGGRHCEVGGGGAHHPPGVFTVGACTSHRPGVPPCQDGVPQLPDECHHKDHLLPQHAGLGVECDPLPDHALALLLHPPLCGQPEESEAQVPQLQDSSGEVQ